MDVLHPRCCNLDVHKSSISACILVQVAGRVQKHQRHFGAMRAQVLAQPPSKQMGAEVDYQVAAPAELRTPNLHRANHRSIKQCGWKDGDRGGPAQTKNSW